MKTIVRWLLVLALLVGPTIGIAVLRDGWNGPPAPPVTVPVDPEAADKAARRAAIVACDREPLGGGTVDEQIDRRMACLAREGYR